MKLLLIDGNYFMHRAFHMVVKTRDPAYIQKNVLTLVASMVFSEIVLHRATHVAITFDAPNCWRLDVYPKYKERRRKPKDPIMVTHPKYSEPVQVTDTVGDMITAAKKMLKAAGLKVYHKARLESDDLLGSLTVHFKDEIPIVISTRDKDMAGLVDDEKKVVQYWPVEKKFMREKDVLAYYGVRPFQIRDYLSLTGDQVDDIPGVPGVKAKTAAKMLGQDTLKNRLRGSSKLRERLLPYKSRIAMAQKLTTLKIVGIADTLEDLVPQKPDKETLFKALWALPKALDSIRDVAHAAKFKGLFQQQRSKK